MTEFRREMWALAALLDSLPGGDGERLTDWYREFLTSWEEMRMA